MSYFGSCQQPQHPAKLAPNAPVFAQRIGAGWGKGGKTPKTNRLTECNFRWHPQKKQNVKRRCLPPQVSFGGYVCGDLIQLTPGKAPTLSQEFLLETRKKKPQGIMEITLHRLPTGILFSFVYYHCSTIATNRLRTCQASSNQFHSSLKHIVGVWDPGSHFHS